MPETLSLVLPSLLIALGSATLGAIFVSTDAALTSMSSARIAALLEQEELPNKSTLQRYSTAPWRMRSAYTVGRSLCAATSAILLADVIQPFIPGVLGTLLAILATVILYAPISDLAQSIARRSADTWGLRLASYLRPFEFLFAPVSVPLAWASRALSARIQEQEVPDVVASAEVEYFVDEVERSGVVGAEPAEIIRNVLEFEDRRAKDVMVPRNQVEAIELHTALDTVRHRVANSGHSRYPVYEGQLDNVVGLLVAKDVFRVDAPPEPSDQPAASEDSASQPDREPLLNLSAVVRRDVIFVPEQQKLVTLLREMRHKRQHLAVVVDEFGGTSGIVTMEDVIEEIVGDIRDEHDEAEGAPIQELGEGRLLASGALPLGDLFAYLGFQASDADEAQPLSSVFEDGVHEGFRTALWGLELVVREVRGGVVERVEIIRAHSDFPPGDDGGAGDGVDTPTSGHRRAQQQRQRAAQRAAQPSSPPVSRQSGGSDPSAA